MVLRIIVSLLVLSGLCSISFADEYAALTTATAEELLLFWEAKDLYVETATRHFKPISQTAENITVITAKDIEDMSVLSTADVLNRVPGIFIDFTPEDFESLGNFHIQGSETRHVLVLIDGVVWNLPTEGTAETSTIPVRTIDRIEIIKGPASSAWGSSLGGVINIITKKTGDGTTPSGSVSASYGERNSRDYNAEISGKTGIIGYYLFAGRKESDGLRNGRWFDRNSFYSKFNVKASKDISVTLTAGYSEPELFSGKLEIPVEGITQTATTKLRAFFATVSLYAELTKELQIKLSLNTLDRRFLQPASTVIVFDGDVLTQTSDFVVDDKTDSGSAQLIWTQGMHAAVIGSEVSDINTDTFLQIDQTIGGETTSTSFEDDQGLMKWAVYINDTMTLDKLTVTPGVRYDRNDIKGDFTSPSIGVTYSLSDRTILRASAARGFSSPPLNFTSGTGLFFEPNPDLRPESVWSYQAGIESGLADYLWLKAVLFRHEMKDGIIDVRIEHENGVSTTTKENEDKIDRTGIEIEAETAPFYNTSVKAGFAYVDIDPVTDVLTNGKYSYNMAIKYDDKKSLMAQLSGRYIWWYFGNAPLFTAKYDDFIWDVNIRKNIHTTERTNTELFFAAHNIFNGSYYTLNVYQNPRRWVEAGVRLKF